MKSDTLTGILLIGILAVCGWPLAKGISQSRFDPSARLAFRFEGGMDVKGNLVQHLPPPRIKTTAVFLLRGASLQADLKFWRDVHSRLSAGSRVRLVAYCDGAACADAVRSESQSPAFPVIEYGEVVSTESLVNADAQGALLLVREEWHQAKRTVWRVPGRTAESVVQEALR